LNFRHIKVQTVRDRHSIPIHLDGESSAKFSDGMTFGENSEGVQAQTPGKSTGEFVSA
jgi:hypothetical protein